MRDPNLTVSKLYFPEDATLQVHQLRVCPSPAMLPAGFYWYGAKCQSPRCTPNNWLRQMLTVSSGDHGGDSAQDADCGADEPELTTSRKSATNRATPCDATESTENSQRPHSVETDAVTDVAGPEVTSDESSDRISSDSRAPEDSYHR